MSKLINVCFKIRSWKQKWCIFLNKYSAIKIHWDSLIVLMQHLVFRAPAGVVQIQNMITGDPMVGLWSPIWYLKALGCGEEFLAAAILTNMAVGRDRISCKIIVLLVTTYYLNTSYICKILSYDLNLYWIFIILKL